MNTGAFFPDPNKPWRDMMKKMEFPDPGKRIQEIAEGLDSAQTVLRQLEYLDPASDRAKQFAPFNPSKAFAEGILSKMKSQNLAAGIAEEWLRQSKGSESLVRLATDLRSHMSAHQLTSSLADQITNRMNAFHQSQDLAASVLAQLQQTNLAAQVLAQAGAFTLAQNAALQLSAEGMMEEFRSQVGVASLLSAHSIDFNALSTKAAKHYVSRRASVDDEQVLIDEVFDALVTGVDSDAGNELERATAPLAINERLMIEGAEFWGFSAVPKTDRGRIVLGILVGYLVGLVYVLGVMTGEDLTIPELTKTAYETVGYASGSGGFVYGTLRWGPAARKKLDEMTQETKGEQEK